MRKFIPFQYLFLLCAALLTACSPSPSPSSPPLLPATPTSLAVPATDTVAPPATAEESTKEISTPLVVTAKPPPTRPAATALPSLPPLPQVTAAANCPGTQVSILMPGRRARVSNTSATSNRLRAQPGTSGEKVGEIAPGVFFDVISGPQCANGMAWFEVKSDTGVQGWMAEGNAEEYWVMPIVTDMQEASGPVITLPGFNLSLPAEVGSQVQILTVPFVPETRTPPVTIARLVDYPLPNHTAAVYVYPLEDYLYYRPDAQASLEQLRAAITQLSGDPNARVSLPNVVISLSLSETYLPQAGTFNGGMGVRAIAMLAPTDGSQEPQPYYAFWGFSADMNYLLFAALDTRLTFGQLAQATANDFQPGASLLDQIFAFKPAFALQEDNQPENALACPGASEIKLAVDDWVRVSVDPPLGSRIRSQPGSQGEIVGEALPGENLRVLDGPQCANGYAWWQVRSLKGLEGWAAEGDTESYWLVEPIRVWSPLPAPLQMGSPKTYDLRELRISPETSLVSSITGEYQPLATPLPTPGNAETPMPDDPRGGTDFGATQYAAHSVYEISGGVKGFLWVYELEDPLSRSFLNYDCVMQVRASLENHTLAEEYLKPFCGMNGALPLHFKTDIAEIQFTGGRGLRFLISSSNYLTVNQMDFRFQGFSDDGRYFINLLIYNISHPYIVDHQLFEGDFGPLLAWKEGQYEQAEQSYDVFNARIKELLVAGEIPLYPSLEILDAMLASIEIK